MSDNLSSLVGPSEQVGFSWNIEQDANDKIDPNVLELFKNNVKEAKELRSGQDIYPMKAKVRGYCVIIDNAEFEKIPHRPGSEADAKRLKEIFTQMGFLVRPYKNLTAGEMHNSCDVISKEPKLLDHDALVVIILSHGGDGGLICGKDYQEIGGMHYGCVTDKVLLHVFNDKNCPLLKDKPKMFFFNCCRGSRIDQIQKDSVHNDVLSNVFAGYGTRDGYRGYRDLVYGSHFTIALAAELIQHSWDKELKDIFNEITKHVEDIRHQHVKGKRFIYQSPTCVEYNWRKKLYFNTGLYETNSDLTEPIANTSTPKGNTNLNPNFDIRVAEGENNEIRGEVQTIIAENVPNAEVFKAMNENTNFTMRAAKGKGNVIQGNVTMKGIHFANPK